MESASQLLSSLSNTTGISESDILIGSILTVSIIFISAVIKSILRIGILLFVVYVGYTIVASN